jgi:hypothetical protein
MMVSGDPMGSGGSITDIAEARCGEPGFGVRQMWATRHHHPIPCVGTRMGWEIEMVGRGGIEPPHAVPGK